MADKICIYNRSNDPVSDYPVLIRATFYALKNYNQPIDKDDIEDVVANILNLTDEQINRRDPGYWTTELEGRLGWVRTMLKRYGLITNNNSAQWYLTQEGKKKEDLSEQEAESIYECRGHKNKEKPKTQTQQENEQEIKDELYDRLKHINWRCFEDFTADLLTGCGFTDLEQTEYIGDGGIDGTAKYNILDIGEVSVAYQCKHHYDYQQVSAAEIRDFLGSKDCENKTLKIFISITPFADKAIERAKQSNVLYIDGDKIIELMLKYEIGCKKINGFYEVDETYFENLIENQED